MSRTAYWLIPLFLLLTICLSVSCMAGGCSVGTEYIPVAEGILEEVSGSFGPSTLYIHFEGGQTAIVELQLGSSLLIMNAYGQMVSTYQLGNYYYLFQKVVLGFPNWYLSESSYWQGGK